MYERRISPPSASTTLSTNIISILTKEIQLTRLRFMQINNLSDKLSLTSKQNYKMCQKYVTVEVMNSFEHLNNRQQSHIFRKPFTSTYLSTSGLMFSTSFEE